MRSFNVVCLMGLALVASGHSSFAMGKKPVVAGVEAYRRMSFDIKSQKETILCQGQGYIVGFAGGIPHGSRNTLFVMEEASQQTKLFENFDSEGSGWNDRDISRFSNMERLKGFIENPRPTYSEYHEQGLPEVQDALTFASQSDTDLATDILNSTVNDLSIEHVAANLWWKNEATYTSAVFKMTPMKANFAPFDVATTCITVETESLPKQLKDAYALRVSQHGLISDLYGITFNTRDKCARELISAYFSDEDFFDLDRASRRDVRFDAIRTHCAQTVADAKVKRLQEFKAGRNSE